MVKEKKEEAKRGADRACESDTPRHCPRGLCTERPHSPILAQHATIIALDLDLIPIACLLLARESMSHHVR
jgi:hypothetical protein